MNKPTREVVEAMVNIATNGALDRIDQRGTRARALYQWGLHPHHAEDGSPLAADNASFEAAYPLALSGGVGVTEESLFPMMSAAENLNAAGLLIEHRPDNGNVHAMPVMQLCRSAMESSARTIWILGNPNREVRRDRAWSVRACHSICVSPGWSIIGSPFGRTEGVFCDEGHRVGGWG